MNPWFELCIDAVAVACSQGEAILSVTIDGLILEYLYENDAVTDIDRRLTAVTRQGHSPSLKLQILARMHGQIDVLMAVPVGDVGRLQTLAMADQRDN